MPRNSAAWRIPSSGTALGYSTSSYCGSSDTTSDIRYDKESLSSSPTDPVACLANCSWARPLQDAWQDAW